MKFLIFLRFVSALLIIFCLYTAPIATLAAAKPDGNKNFKQGLQYEVREQWDKAAEEFALAVAAKPGNTEYRLHYRRALFNASQMMVQRGRTLAEQKDYVGAYNAFRQAYGYDPTNELAKAEMERMLRLQQQGEDPNDPNKPKESPSVQPPAVKLVPTAYNQNAAAPQQQDAPPQVEQLRDIKYTRVDLKTVIRDLAKALDLNVIFDAETFRSPREFSIELTNVTTAQALDYIFLQESLFFQRVGKRAILVANQNRRQNFQQLVLRTFYLANAKPDDVRNLLTQAIPPQPGRPPVTAIVDKDTNSITVRDTTENLRIIANLIKAVDKDRAEVVMDVNIFEVSKTDLLNLGVQIGNEAGLTNLGGSTSAVVGIGGSDNFGQTTNSSGVVTGLLPRNIATGILLPAATIQAFQRKDNTRLLASTQVHAFNNEESTARIGQRVPVQTAQVYGGFTGNTGAAGNAGGIGNVFGSNGYPVINYEQVGLTLKFTPIVFPNQDVQVKMQIESKDVLNASLTPTFTERTIGGTARIQNNRTLLLASVAQDTQSNGRAGLPLLGLIPVLGRLFSAPRRNNSQVDIVIAVTPRVLRAPAILPEDEVERPTGSIAVPTNSSLATMLQQEDQDDRLAAARRVPNTAVVQLPDQKTETEVPAYTGANRSSNGNQNNAVAAPTTVVSTQSNAPAVTPKPIDATIKTLNIAPTGDKSNAQPSVTEQTPVVQPIQTTTVAPQPTEPLIKIEPLGALIKGERRRVAVMVNSPSALRLAVLSLGFDAGKIRVNKVVYGDVYAAGTARTDAPPFASANGVLMATLPIKTDALAQGAGVLAYLDIEALADGDAALRINSAASSLIGVNGENLVAIK